MTDDVNISVVTMSDAGGGIGDPTVLGPVNEVIPIAQPSIPLTQFLRRQFLSRFNAEGLHQRRLFRRASQVE